MLLAEAYREAPDALRADLQRVYGIDLDHAMAGSHSAGHVAALTAHLPSDSCIYKARSADAQWGLDDVLLASLLNSLNALIYAMADPKRRGSKPPLVGPSYIANGRARKLDARTMTADELMAILAKPRR